jgi:hypothetical protein
MTRAMKLAVAGQVALRHVVLPALLFSMLGACSGCKKDGDGGARREGTPPPPPSANAAKPGACAGGGGQVADPVSAPFFPRTVSGYCVDPQGEVRTYGERGKLSMEQVCTTAFDGECEVYKGFGLKRVVALRYVDGSGKGGVVEVNLSQFADEAGAFGMYTMRVVAGDPADPSTPKPLAAGAAGAIGTGRAYVVRGAHLAELQYTNDNESPAELAKSSDAILTAIGQALGAKLPGPTTPPPAEQALPAANRVPNGVLFEPKDVMGWKAIGPAAMGFYKDASKRWRVLSIVKDDADQAKDAMKTIASTPGSLPVPNVGDQAAHVVVTTKGEEGAGSGAKIEGLVARKGRAIFGVFDEEYALKDGGDKARLTKEEALARLKPLLAAPVPADGATSSKPSASSSAARDSGAPPSKKK